MALASPTRKKPGPPKVYRTRLVVPATVELAIAARQLARERGTSMSDEVREALTNHLAAAGRAAQQ